MTVTLSLFAGAGAQFFTDNGTPLSGGKIYTYYAGSTTPLTTYTTSSGSIAHPNPIILNAAGRVPSGGEIWLTFGVGYKFIVKTSDEFTVATYDNIPSSPQPPVVNDAASITYEQGYTVTAGNFIVGKTYKIVSLGDTNFQLIGATSNTVGLYFIATGAGTGTGTAELSQTVEAKLQQTVSVKDFGAVGNGIADDTVAIQAALTYAASIVDTIITNKVNIVTAAVYLPAGVYKTTAALNVGEGVTFYGESQSTAVIKPTHTGNAINMGGNTREYSQIRICNLGIIGNRTGALTYGSWTTTTTIGIYAENCIRECAIENCFITQCDTSIKTENSYAFEINQCYLIYALSYHIHADNAVNWTISGNRIDWSEKHGIYLNGTNAGDETLAALIQGNAIQLCWRNGIWLYDCSSASMINNFFEGNYREAVPATYTYADINIEDGAIAARTYAFNIIGNFFTHGSSPDEDVFTAIKCNKAVSLNAIGNTCRDSFYRYFIYADYVDVQKIVALGNALTGTFTNIAYNSATTFGLIEDQIGNNVVAIPKFFSGSTQYGTTVSSSNQTTDEFNTMYLINCSGGNRQLNLRDADCVAGRIYTVKKTDGGAVNFIRAIPESGSTKTIDGAANVSSTAAYAVIRVVSDGSNWFTI